MEIPFLSETAHLARFSGLAVTIGAALVGNKPSMYMIGGILMAAGIGMEAVYHYQEGELLV